MYFATNPTWQQIAVLFYEKRLKNNWWQFSKSEELICWEQWAITITVLEPQSEQGIFTDIQCVTCHRFDYNGLIYSTYAIHREAKNKEVNGTSAEPKFDENIKHHQ
jgi:hypothetical protein